MTGVPTGAGVYLALMIVTFALHALLIGCVLAGAGYVAVRLLRGGDDPVAAATRDWLPFALGAAITAGVAPLLFVQLLYQPRFYTANLLLFARWMAIIPALVIGFYALYLGKSARAAAWSRRARAAVAWLAAACFVFVAWSWIDDHALAMQREPGAWATLYAQGGWRHQDPSTLPRLVLWAGVAALVWPAGLLVVAPGRAGADQRRVAWIALAGLAVATVGGALAVRGLEPARTMLALAPARPWLYGLGAAAVALAVGWGAVVTGRRPWRLGVLVATAIFGLALAGAREAMRLAAIDPRLDARVGHAQGVWLFVLAMVVGAVAIGWCVVIARRAGPPRTLAEPVPPVERST
ncbi:MAG: hypothetical protein R3B06_25530 [Kofleriaceae bacterium]